MIRTYRQLQEALSTMTDDQLNADITVEDDNQGEFLPAELNFVNDDQSVLDIGHPTIRFPRKTGE